MVLPTVVRECNTLASMPVFMAIVLLRVRWWQRFHIGAWNMTAANITATLNRLCANSIRQRHTQKPLPTRIVLCVWVSVSLCEQFTALLVYWLQSADTDWRRELCRNREALRKMCDTISFHYIGFVCVCVPSSVVRMHFAFDGVRFMEALRTQTSEKRLK